LGYPLRVLLEGQPDIDSIASSSIVYSIEAFNNSTQCINALQKGEGWMVAGGRR
jgi:hypothetical protein